MSEIPRPTIVWGDDQERTCSLCGTKFVGMGNNPEPLAEFEERCCDRCNWQQVIPARFCDARTPAPRS